MKILLTVVCDIDLPDTAAQGVSPQQVAETAKDVAERALRLAMRGAGLGLKSTAVISNPKDQ